MSFDQDPNEQANISGYDLAIMADELKSVTGQRDSVWKELREIREAIGANTEESTLDEVRRVVVQRDGLLKEMRRAVVAAAHPSAKAKEECYAILDAAIANAGSACLSQITESETQASFQLTDDVQTSAPAIVFYQAGGPVEEIYGEGCEA